MKRYSAKEVETKWQKNWQKTGIYEADLQSSKPKYVAMSMFNYPSGAGIHIGHAMNYTISDVKARFKRQQGFESYHPVGWDAFGLPAENYAIKAGVSPQASMAKIIPSYHKQYMAMGWSNDWSKEISTHTPEYYKWTQWIFIQMHKHGLAYKDSRMQWWCGLCQTVLANEQVIDGKCWRHDGAEDPDVAKKEVSQWFFKITEYADELLDAIDSLDWTESVKLAQKNWIGRSKGAEIDFDIQDSPKKIKVFTTRPDTLFGATFMVLAPEHPLLTELTLEKQKPSVDKYLKQAQAKSELERQVASDKNKTGVFTGSYAINPINNQPIPIWTADYVLMGYGTGAIMAVPAHDERDNAFAKRYNLEIKKVINTKAGLDTEGTMLNSGKYNAMPSEQAREKIVEDLQVKGKAKVTINYKMRDWSVSRQRYWGAPIPIINCKDCGDVLVPEDELPVILPELDDFQPSGDGRSALARATNWLKADCPSCGGKAHRETDTLDTYICSSWYMFRYFDPKNKQKIFNSDVVNKWLPIDFYNGGDHATAHLLYARFIARFFTKLGIVDNPEPFKQMLFNGKVMASDGSAFSKSKGNGVDPLEIINQGYGADALRMFLMFAAPLEFSARWDEQGVPGTHRFLSRVWALAQEYLEATDTKLSAKSSQALLRSTHRMIKKVTEDIEDNRYNTAIASLMQAVNEMYKLKTKQFGKCEEWQEAIEAVVACVAPFSPHIADELWQQLGHNKSVQKDSWPQYMTKYLQSDKVIIAVQINGKVRAEIEVAAGSSQDEIVKKAMSSNRVKEHLAGKQIKKTIYVPDKIVSFVV